ncbi:tripartite ATP-independent transporter DctM subunit [Altererythrobacter atlanticus]|uniref:TRAP transporter large permease protein n=1 Tax=Croceibacterium atlanticum TaxID=1267766 RepID=A0A0F7KQQ8_9SPHN|nr:TRAP transporter large permease [Croceibacterium atlanticum]AKH41507.1 Sialic acid TRAP transporter permease protein SiaT [Croceibacterium atlanticum]MBB5732969.1 tripartite ATP-independent transporter DctM subunit [Croceibacterium atlanticum]
MIDTPGTGLIGLLVLFALLFAGGRIGAVLGIVGLGGLALVLGPEAALIKGGVVVVDTLTKYELGTLPLFLFMAHIFFSVDVSRDLFDAAAKLVGHRRGGLAYASIAGCAGFGAINGSSLATTATVGLVAYPEMKQRGYDDRLSTATIAAGGTLGQMIPPSGALIVYGIIAEQSIGRLFTAAIIPGITQALLYAAVVFLLVRARPQFAPAGDRVSWAERWQALGRIWEIGLLMLLVIGGIALGWISPPEAAAVGAAGALAIAAIRGKLSRETLFTAFAETLRTTGLIFLIVIGALIFSVFVGVTGLSDAIGEVVLGLGAGTFVTLLLIGLVLLLLGTVLDGLGLMLLMTPILLPIVEASGMTAIWFGIFLVRAMEVGFLTPPLGINLYVMQGVAKDISIANIFRGVMPFLASDVLHLLLLILFPAMVLWLPRLLGN